MPKVSHYTITIDGEYRKFDIHYSKGKPFHLKDFPDLVSKFSGVSHKISSGYTTERELCSAIAQVVDLYHKNSEKTRKVILCKLEATTIVTMNKVDERSFSGSKEWVPENISVLRSAGWGMSLSYELAYEVDKNGKKYFQIRQDGSIGYELVHSENEGILLEWTAEREKSLASICSGIEQLTKKVASIILDKEKASVLLDSGNVLLIN